MRILHAQGKVWSCCRFVGVRGHRKSLENPSETNKISFTWNPSLPQNEQKFALLGFTSKTKDRFQVSHFRPVVMDIKIGGRPEKSLGSVGRVNCHRSRMYAFQCKLAQFWPLQLSFPAFFFWNQFPVDDSGYLAVIDSFNQMNNSEKKVWIMNYMYPARISFFFPLSLSLSLSLFLFLSLLLPSNRLNSI